jgi:hypothetical protein
MLEDPGPGEAWGRDQREAGDTPERIGPAQPGKAGSMPAAKEKAPLVHRRGSLLMTSSASWRAARSAFSLAAPALMSSPRVLTPMAPVSRDQSRKSIRQAGHGSTRPGDR